LNNGRLIAQAPLDELLAGSEGKIFSVTIDGDEGDTRSELMKKSWVSGIVAHSKNGLTSWQVNVSNEDIANEKLLRTILRNEKIKVLDYGQKKLELEDVFLDLVEGDGYVD
jgi:ABC-2 type transport system ATP-binding protein